MSFCLSIRLFMLVISECTNWILMDCEGLQYKFNADLILNWICSQYHVRCGCCGVVIFVRGGVILTCSIVTCMVQKGTFYMSHFTKPSVINCSSSTTLCVFPNSVFVSSV